MDHVANWVRFADTKATILIAGLGVVLTMVMTNVETVATAIRLGQPEAAILYPLVILTSGAFLWTLFWLMYAIGPRRTTTLPGINRFAWPTLVKADPKALIERGLTEDVREDAWRQVVDLSNIAERKFAATNKATWGFGLVLALAALLVTTSIATTSNQGERKVDVPAPTQTPKN